MRWLLLAVGLTGWIAASAWLNDQPGPVDMRMMLGRLVILVGARLVISAGAVAILYACLDSRSPAGEKRLGGAPGQDQLRALHAAPHRNSHHARACFTRVGDGSCWRPRRWDWS